MLKVKILDGDPYWMIKYADADGNVYLDIDSDFTILLYKESEQLTNLSKINIEAVLGTSLIATPKNSSLIGKPTLVGVNHNSYSDFRVQITSGLKILNQSKLRVQTKKNNKETNNYQIEIIDTTNHWAVAFNEIYLDELPFNQIEISDTFLWDNFNTANHYDDGEDGYYFPIVNYGTFPNLDYYTLDNFRVWIHALKTMQLSYTKAGWQFSCPFLESNIGRKLITYVLKDTTNEDAELLNSRQFEAHYRASGINRENTVALQWSVPKKWTIYDIKMPNYYGFYYDELTGKFNGVVRANFIAELFISISVNGKSTKGRTHIVIQIVKEKADGTIIEYGNDAEREWHEDDIDFDDYVTLSKEIYVYPDEKVFLRLKAGGLSGGQINLKYTSRFYNEPIAFIPQAGELYNVQKQLRHDKVIDYLKGIAHLANFKFYTNFTERKVYILTPYDQTFFGDLLTGYYTNTIQDFTNKIEITDNEIIVPQEEKKNLYFKFKDSSDAKIQDLKLAKYKDLYSNFIDNGQDLENGTEVLENPYFEPTLNDSAGINDDIDMPFLLDNLDGKNSTKISPRIVIAYGMKDLGRGEKNYFNTIKTYSVPYSYQVGKDTNFIPDNYLIYGKAAFDLYTLFYKKYINEFNNCLKVKTKLLINHDQYESITFRDKLKLSIDGTSAYGRILGIGNYDPENESGLITIKLDNTSDPTCLDYEEVNNCNNNPEIIVTPTGGGNYTISAGGTNESGVTSTTIEWRFFDDVGWTAGSSFMTLSKKVYARITWIYDDGCESLNRVKTIEPCSNYPKLCWEKIFPEPYALNVYECGTHSETPISFIYEYSTNNISWNIIPDPFLLSDLGETTYLRVTCKYTNCPDSFATAIYVNIPDDNDCDYDGVDAPTIVFVTSPAGLTIERKGYFVAKSALDIIWFRKVNGDDEWDLYDDANKEILNTENGTNWEAYRVIMFCNGDCPIYCCDPVTANNDCAGLAEIIDSSALTYYDVRWENPTLMDNTWLCEIEDDSIKVVPLIRAYLEQNIGGTITEFASKLVQYEQQNFKTEFVFTWNQTDTVKLIKISKNVAGVQTLGLNCNIGFKFETGATNDELITGLSNKIVEKLFSTFNIVKGIDYDFIVTVTGSGSTRSAKVSFIAKNVVNSTWYGVNATSDYLQTETVGLSTTNHASTKTEFQIVTTPFPIVLFHSPFGNEMKVRFKVNLTTRFIDDSASNFDIIVPNTSITIVDETVTIDSDSGQRHELSLSLTGITSPTYLWKRGKLILGTDATIVTYGNYYIKCIVGSNDGCYYLAETFQ